jgi:hypothetical protein
MGKEPQYPFIRKLGGFQSWSGCFTKKNNFLSLLKIESLFSGCPACCLVSIPKKEKTI